MSPAALIFSESQRAALQAMMIRTELIMRRMQQRELGAKLGWAVAYTYQVITGRSTCPRSRRKLEAYLRIPVWCPREEWAERLARIDFFGGIDIATLSVPKLVALCDARGLLGNRRTHLPRDYFLNLLEIHFAEKHQTPPPALRA